jgi:hypothetical protein
MSNKLATFILFNVLFSIQLILTMSKEDKENFTTSMTAICQHHQHNKNVDLNHHATIMATITHKHTIETCMHTYTGIVKQLECLLSKDQFNLEEKKDIQFKINYLDGNIAALSTANELCLLQYAQTKPGQNKRRFQQSCISSLEENKTKRQESTSLETFSRSID